MPETSTSSPSSIVPRNAQKEAELEREIEEEEEEHSSDDEDAQALRHAQAASPSIIGKALEALGFYCSSIKPGKGNGWIGQGAFPITTLALFRPPASPLAFTCSSCSHLLPFSIHLSLILRLRRTSTSSGEPAHQHL